MNENLELWAFHTGVGTEHFPAPSKEAAEAKAIELNRWLSSATGFYDGIGSAKAVKWSGTAAAHQAGLKEWVPAKPN